MRFRWRREQHPAKIRKKFSHLRQASVGLGPKRNRWRRGSHSTTKRTGRGSKLRTIFSVVVLQKSCHESIVGPTGERDWKDRVAEKIVRTLPPSRGRKPETRLKYGASRSRRRTSHVGVWLGSPRGSGIVNGGQMGFGVEGSGPYPQTGSIH